MGKLIVIDGVDASGKQTQSDLLYGELERRGHNLKKVQFPDYEDDSSALVRMYLNGELSDNADGVNCYAASTFYAVDRYASFKKHWETFYNGDGVIIADRYTTSNAIHQCAKLPEEKHAEFLDWLYDFEYSKLGIPKPDLVIFLDMPPEYAVKLMEQRYNGDETKKDIHEKDMNFLTRSYNAAVSASEHSGWCRVRCVKDGKVRTREDIHSEIMETVLGFFSESTQAAKKKLRKRAKELNQDIDSEDREKYDKFIFENTVKSELYRSARDVYIYYSSLDEAGTQDIIDQALADGKKVYLPKCNKEDCTMEFLRVEQGTELVMNMYGILEPTSGDKGVPTVDSVAFVPGVAFDLSGNRLGRGKGYYDRFLDAFPGKAVGVAYHALVLDQVPCDVHDKKMDAIITEKGVIYSDS